MEVPGTADPAPEGLGSPDLRLPGETRQQEEAEGQAGIPPQECEQRRKNSDKGSRDRFGATLKTAGKFPKGNPAHGILTSGSDSRL